LYNIKYTPYHSERVIYYDPRPKPGFRLPRMRDFINFMENQKKNTIQYKMKERFFVTDKELLEREKKKEE